MYHLNGKFGQVRLSRSFVNPKNMRTPFAFLQAGWHRCNDLYRISRPHGLDSYTIFFSLTEGGRFRLQNKVYPSGYPVVQDSSERALCGKIYEIPASSIAILPPGMAHEYYAEKGGWWEFYWLHTGKRNTQILEKIIETQGYVFSTSRTAAIGKMIERIFPEQTSPDDILFEITASRVVSDIFHMMWESSYTAAAHNQKDIGLIPKIIHEIEEHYMQDLKIAALADANYLSQQHMIRVFKAETGYTPYEYLKKYRLKKAAELLSFTDFPVTEIAAFTGFPSSSNFIYQFRKEHGMTPAKYRRR